MTSAWIDLNEKENENTCLTGKYSVKHSHTQLHLTDPLLFEILYRDIKIYFEI